MESQCHDDTLRTRGTNSNLCILRMLEDTFSLGAVQLNQQNDFIIVIIQVLAVCIYPKDTFSHAAAQIVDGYFVVNVLEFFKFNPFMPIGLFYLTSLDRFISLYKGCLVSFYYFHVL